MHKEHIKELDVLRMISFILVVAQHVFGAFAWREGAGFSESLILSLLYVIAQPAVPIFVTITAISLFYNYSEKINVLGFYKKRFRSIFLPYLIWTIINIWDGRKYGEAVYGDFIGQILAGTGRYHLWYMSMILRIYLFFPLIVWVFKPLQRRGKVFKVSFFSAYFVFYIILLKNNGITEWIGKKVFINPTFNELRFLDRTPLLWSIYFLIGVYVISSYPQFVSWLSRFQKQIVLTYIPLLFYNYYIEINPHVHGYTYILNGYLSCFLKVSFMTLSIFVFYSLSRFISSRKSKLYRICEKTSPYSYAAYLAHVIVLQEVAMTLMNVFPIKSLLIAGLIIFSLTILLTVKLIELLSLLPVSQYLLGTRYKYHPTWLDKSNLPSSF